MREALRTVPPAQTNRTYVRYTWDVNLDQNRIVDDDLTPEEIEQLRRRRIVRAAIVVVVVVAMVATLLFPVIIRVVRPSRSPDVVIAIHDEVPWRRMGP